MNAIEIKNLSFSYKTYSILSKKIHPVLKGISLSLKQNSTLGLLGKSGCGKSTLASIIMGLIRPDSGEVEVLGAKFNSQNLKAKKEFYKNIQIVFQDPISAVNPSFSVKNVVEEPLLHLSDLSEKERLERIIECLEAVQISPDFLDRVALTLSGGQLQRVCIARALAIKPKILILDESLSSLDMVLQSEILEILLGVKHKLSILFITHDIRLARLFCDEIILLDDGVVVESVKNSDKFTSPLARELTSAAMLEI